MQRFQQSEPKKKKLPTSVLLFFLVIVFLILLSSVIQLTRKQMRIQSAIRQLKSQRESLVEKQGTLTATVGYLQTTEGKEQALRDKYRLVKPGEGLVVITDPKSESGTEKDQRNGFFRRFFRAVHDVFSKEE